MIIESEIWKLRIKEFKYIDEYKLKLAQKMLKDTTLSVSQIAETLGYFDVQGFSKFFPKRKGFHRVTTAQEQSPAAVMCSYVRFCIV